MTSQTTERPAQRQGTTEIEGERKAMVTIQRDADREMIYGEIDAERARQDLQWGGPEHDDTHVPTDWFEYITWQYDKLSGDVGQFIDNDANADDLVADAIQRFSRPRLVKIAALAVAGIESLDRQGERE